jgi:hypothetical protein
VTIGSNALLQDVIDFGSPDKSLGDWFCMGDVLTAALSAGMLLNTPRRGRPVVMSRKKRSTMFNQEAEVGVK